jgi:hypothetical protein
MSTIPARASRTQQYPMQVDDVDDVPDNYYPQRRPSSAIRYTTTEGHQVIERGNKRIVIHDEPPPRRKVHWSLIFGIGMVSMLVLWLIGTTALNFWSVTQDDLHYGRPRTFQIDQRVGHSDDTTPSHFIAVNLNRHIEVIEFPGGDATHAKVYFAMTLVGDGQDLAVVSLAFKDVNGDGKPDMIVTVNDTHAVFINDNGQFRSLKQGEQISF